MKDKIRRRQERDNSIKDEEVVKMRIIEMDGTKTRGKTKQIQGGGKEAEKEEGKQEGRRCKKRGEGNKKRELGIREINWEKTAKGRRKR